MSVLWQRTLLKQVVQYVRLFKSPLAHHTDSLEPANPAGAWVSDDNTGIETLFHKFMLFVTVFGIFPQVVVFVRVGLQVVQFPEFVAVENVRF